MAGAAPAGATLGAAAATADPPLAEGDLQQVGPGLYSAAERSFEIYETDVADGLMSRSHTVSGPAGGVATPQSAPASRPDMGVFGPGWEAEFLGGQLNRKLEQKADSVVVTDLEENVPLTYTLTSSVDFPSGGGVRRYASAAGDKLTDTTRFDEASGKLVSTIVETLTPGAVTADTDVEAGGDADAAAPLGVDTLTPTYTWKQAVTGTDSWRVTGVGNVADGVLSSAGYDTKGRIATIKEAAAGETPEQSVTVKYSAATTATAAAAGEYAGRVKEITVTTGATTQTLARYAYDTTGLLRSVANPVEGTDTVSSYDYDTTGRVSDVASPSNGTWDLSFPGDAVAPNVEAVGPARPTSQSVFSGASGITDSGVTTPPATDFTTGEISDPQAYPRHCNRATDWLWYLESGCAAWAAHYGWHKPLWKQTPTKHWVVGINNDGCSTPGPNVSRPGGFNFRTACDMHDYGYGLIGNTYKGYRYYLDRSKKAAVDNAFHTTMKTYSCKAYFITRRPACRTFAYAYYKAVGLKGRPVNGANAT
ncbi:phospholipase A2 [Streptomyces sp. ME02-8801-2C]|uniref:phospholipase A2 n=1 Tax=Streptomyces sp. ME02-8801-2C TaxID=3028680 RepID=UPI0029B2544A|nr:phospholipase A2 [Streptomyces sp. ME02-8801-2C]MDX3458977.1 phospholipase A2 [Streptomyces sp. ME02-8801-2C]